MVLKNLQIGYKDSAPIVDAIDAELCLGSFVCLIGRNGTGKSTLLRTLAGIQEPLSGTLTAASCSIVSTQTPNLQNTTVQEMVSYGRLPYMGTLCSSQENDIDVIDKSISMLGISHLAHRNFATLSDGEKQKVMVARALAQGGDYLFLDEPTAFLDYSSKEDMMDRLRQLAHNHKKGILLSTHDLDLAFRFADVLWELNEQPLQFPWHDPQPPRLFFRTMSRSE
ncbi:MAG: ABC transporter ATP-binding protein [Bacteroidales bacterium]|nr:ABC transporter ATP-binding protein [Bacteroidales bacterium]